MAITPYALRRLDEWYFKRVARAYTPQLEKRILQDLQTIDPEAGELILGTRAAHSLRREGAIESSRTYFSRLAKESNNYHERIHDLQEVFAPDVFNEYIAPLAERFGTLRQFVDHISRMAPDDLDDETITQQFSHYFDGTAGFAHLCDRLLAASLIPLDLLSNESPISGQRLYRAMAPALRRMIRATFNDLR